MTSTLQLMTRIHSNTTATTAAAALTGNFHKPPPTPPQQTWITPTINPSNNNNNDNSNNNNSNSNNNNDNMSLPGHLFDYHTHPVGPNQCCSAVVRTISASIDTVWAILRRFDNPQTYKHFLKTCRIIVGDGQVAGSLREVHVISGLPAASSIERLEILDDENRVLSFSVVGGVHRLNNYRSVTTLHPNGGDTSSTVVVESYVVDVPAGNTKEETCMFVDTIVRCNLQSLATIAENLEKNK